MTTLKSNESVVFNSRTLRLIIGALAFAFPATVIALTGGKVTTSISASYHEVETRDVFVGFLFIIGALLIAYKGHLQGDPRPETIKVWDWIRSRQWVKVYQEDIFSTVGGLAAIFTALHPTACDGCAINTQSRIHMIGAFILFGAVVYFSLIAFLRSLNKKLLGYAELKSDSAFMANVERLRKAKTRTDLNLLKRFWNFLTLEIETFQMIVRAETNRYEKLDGFKKILRLLQIHDKKLARGAVYVVCGSMIMLTLAVFLFFVVTMPDKVAHSITTFVVETISLGFFGIAWMTASQLEYLKRILS